ncbi:MAG: anion transporter [Nannocystaceae bacterium]
MSAHDGVVVAIFALAYALIAARRLAILPIGRPAGALLGAVAMVAVGALTPDESFAAIDHDTLILLFGVMLLSAYLDRAGLFLRLAGALLRRFRRPRGLLVGVSLCAALLSAFLVNDTVCLFLTPLVVRLCVTAGLPLGPYLIALATSANLGSAATLVGNPQNMIIGHQSGLAFVDFLVAALPAVVVGLAANLGLLLAVYGRRLPSRPLPAPEAVTEPWSREAKVAALITAAILAGFFAGLHPGYTVLTGVLALMLRDRGDPQAIFARVDWTLLVFFAGLFIVVAGLASTGLVDAAFAGARGALDLGEPAGVAAFTGLCTLGSNLVSNVPLVLMVGPLVGGLADGPTPWVMLGFVSTVAGNLTLLGSVANIIVAEGARDHYELGFFEYLRFGALSTAVGSRSGSPRSTSSEPASGDPNCASASDLERREARRRAGPRSSPPWRARDAL